MKKVFAIALLSAAAIGLHAADTPVFRADMNASAGKIVLKANKTNTFGANPGWVKQNKEFLLCYWTGKLNPTTWTNAVLSFTPDKAGKITVRFSGQWATKPEDRAWILINQIKLDGKLYPNGDFKKVVKNKAGKEIPVGFTLNAKTQYLPKAGEKGTPAILTNYSEPLTFTMQVEANKTYKFEVKVKAATPELLK